MHGLNPEHIEYIERLRGQEIIQVAVGKFQIQFATGPKNDHGISIEGRCELLNMGGQIVDVWDRGQRSSQFRFFDLPGTTIEGVSIDTSRSFIAFCSDGFQLRVIDNSDRYESFSVGGLFI